MEGVDLTRCFGGVYSGRRVLVTGHTGFKGSWLSLWVKEMGAEFCGMALPPVTEPSHHRLLALGNAETVVDLRHPGEVEALVDSFRPEIVFHLAAQALVRRSFREPVATVTTNVLGLVHLLEALRRCAAVRAVVNVTTDKCYEVDGRANGYAETDRLGGYDPYSASKACAEIISSSWRRSFFGADDALDRPGVLLATARAGNVIGGGDWAEDRLVPDLVRNAVAKRHTPIRSPEAIRPWQHVLEPLSGYLSLGQRLLAGEAQFADAWNFGPERESHLPVRAIVEGLAVHWPRVRAQADGGPHPHETKELRLNWDKARRRLGWRPVWSAPQMLQRTAQWYRTFYASGEVLSRAQLKAYVKDARSAGLAWAAY
ncbi:MAG: CDP-glucose 4,6-dehydratase [Burkholderiales bacterium]|nr:CDP-glucose 4,6-dehydratase [Burkholderiales bacterium]